MLLSLIFYNKCKFYKIQEKQPAAFACLEFRDHHCVTCPCPQQWNHARWSEGFCQVVLISFIWKPLAKYLNQIISIACSDQLISSHEWNKLNALGQRLQTVPLARNDRLPYLEVSLSNILCWALGVVEALSLRCQFSMFRGLQSQYVALPSKEKRKRVIWDYTVTHYWFFDPVWVVQTDDQGMHDFIHQVLTWFTRELRLKWTF